MASVESRAPSRSEPGCDGRERRDLGTESAAATLGPRVVVVLPAAIVILLAVVVVLVVAVAIVIGVVCALVTSAQAVASFEPAPCERRTREAGLRVSEPDAGLANAELGQQIREAVPVHVPEACTIGLAWFRTLGTEGEGRHVDVRHLEVRRPEECHREDASASRSYDVDVASGADVDEGAVAQVADVVPVDVALIGVGPAGAVVVGVGETVPVGIGGPGDDEILRASESLGAVSVREARAPT